MKTEWFPRISVYLTTKNRRELLERAVGSVFGQDYTNWELVIVNDGSTDSTKIYLDELSLRSDRIKVIHHDRSIGACLSRNEAIKVASGDFITGLDDDDWFRKDRLSLFLLHWRHKPKDVVCLFSGYYFEKDGRIEWVGISNKNYCTHENLIYENSIGNQIFARKETFLASGGFDHGFKAWQDLDMWYRVLSKYKAMNIKEPTYYFNISDREDRISNQNFNNIIETYQRFTQKYNLNKKEVLILKLHLINYGIVKLNKYFIFKMLFLTGDFELYLYFNEKYFLPLFKILKAKIACLTKGSLHE